MGSVCCVASRPHGSTGSNDAWSIGPNDPHWRYNGRFSPSTSSRWEHTFQSMDCASGSQSTQLHGASFSSSRSVSRVGSGSLFSHHSGISDSVFSITSSPSESFRTQHWNPLADGGNLDDFIGATPDFIPRHLATVLAKEGYSHSGLPRVHATAEKPFKLLRGLATEATSSSQHLSKPVPNHLCHRQSSDGRVSICSAGGNCWTASSESEGFSQRIFSSSESISRSLIGDEEWWPIQTDAEHFASSGRERLGWPHINSISELSRNLIQEGLGQTGLLSTERIRAAPQAGIPQAIPFTCNSEVQKCGLCSKSLSQRSQCSPHRILSSRDFPVVGVLVCGHAYHAECLDCATPDTDKHDPPCPQCSAEESEKAQGQSRVDTGTKTASLTGHTFLRGKLSRIGVITDRISGLESSSKEPHVNVKGFSLCENGKKGLHSLWLQVVRGVSR